MSLNFDVSKKNIIWNHKRGLPNSDEKTAEAVRLYLELTTPTRPKSDDEGNIIGSEPSPNFVGAILLMNNNQLSNLNLRSNAQREFIQRLIDVNLNRITTDIMEYLGESGFSEKLRTIKTKTNFRELTI